MRLGKYQLEYYNSDDWDSHDSDDEKDGNCKPKSLPFLDSYNSDDWDSPDSDDEKDGNCKPKSLSVLDLSPSESERTDSMIRLTKKSVSFQKMPRGEQQKELDLQQGRQRPVRPSPDLIDEFLKQRNSKVSKSLRQLPGPWPDFKGDFQEQRCPRRIMSIKTSKSPEQSPEPLPDLQGEFREQPRPRKIMSIKASKSLRQSPEPLPDLQGEFREQRSPRRTVSMFESHQGEQSDCQRRSMSFSHEEVTLRRSGSRSFCKSPTISMSFSHEEVTLRRSGSRSFPKSPTPLEWRQQRQQQDNPKAERPGSRRALVKKSKSFRKSPAMRESQKRLKQEEEEERSSSRRSLGRKSASFRNKSPTRRSLGRKSTSFRNNSHTLLESRQSQYQQELTPLEWHQQLNKSEDRQGERPRSTRSLNTKSESSRRKLPTPMEPRQYRKQEDNLEDKQPERRRRPTSGKKSKSLRKQSPSLLELRQSLTQEDEQEGQHPERRRRSKSGKRSKSLRKKSTTLDQKDEKKHPSSRKSLGRKSASFRKESHTPLESRKSLNQEDEEERHSSRKSLRRKTSSFRKKVSTPRISHQHGQRKDQKEEELSEHRSRSRIRKKSPTPLATRQRQYQQHKEDEEHPEGPKKSLGKKSMSFRKSPEKLRSLTPDNVLPKRSKGKRMFLRNLFSNKKQEPRDAVEVDWKGLGFKECSYYKSDTKHNSSGSPNRNKSDSLKLLSPLTKLPRNSLSRNSLTILKEQSYEDVSLGGESRSQPSHLLALPKLEQVLAKKNDRRRKRSDLKKQLLGNVFWGQNHDGSNKHRTESNLFIDNTDRGSIDDTTPNHSNREEDDDEGVLGISKISSVAPFHKLKNKAFMLVLFPKLELYVI